MRTGCLSGFLWAICRQWEWLSFACERRCREDEADRIASRYLKAQATAAPKLIAAKCQSKPPVLGQPTEIGNPMSRLYPLNTG